ncbi:MAG: S26 family signal peptidase [Candidatus Levyibacteriota bacterium]|nr:MAG: S26 family signal peptidase [Candidatus Levybacteria bacterium]
MIFLNKFVVSGHSMEPTILAGTTLLVSSIPYFFKEPKVGDIVVFKRLRKTFVKRIKKKEKQQYFLAGDNISDSLDSRKLGWVRRDDILGKLLWTLS